MLMFTTANTESHAGVQTDVSVRAAARFALIVKRSVSETDV